MRVALNSPYLRIGRSESCDLVLSDPKVSRLHLEMTIVNNQAHFSNVSRSSQFIFGGQEVKKATLSHGQTLTVGGTRLFFLTSEASEFSADDGEATAQTAFGELDEPYEMTVSDHSKARLVVVRPSEIREVKIQKDKLTLGRSSKADLSIDHEKVSRLHCQITLQEDGNLLIEDLGSTNGTFFKGDNVERIELKPNQSFSVGDAKIVFKPAAMALLEEFTVTVDSGSVQALPQLKAARRGAKLAQKGSKRPVIIIPGFLGSELTLNGKVIWPKVKDFLKNPETLKLPEVIEGVEATALVDEVVVFPGLLRLDAYQRLTRYLQENLEYEEGKNLFPFAWDWRRDLRRAASGLGELIHKLRDENIIDEKVILMGHSAGCQVARYYVERMGGRHYVDRLILMGGPMQGSLKPLTSVWNSAGFFGWNKDRVSKVLGSFPGLYQLLPRSECIFHEDGTPFNIWEDKSWLPEEVHPVLDDAREFQEDLPNKSRVPVVSIFGYGQKTAEKLFVKRDDEGKVVSCRIQYTDQGDGTVLQDSAILPDSEIHPVQQQHGALYTDADVRMRLRLELVGL